MNISLM